MSTTQTATKEEGDTTMTSKKAAATTTPRRCIGSARFGIEAHEAPMSEFPVQPSRKDGLGLMCAPHWSAYVKGLREARMAAKAPATEEAASEPGAATRKPRQRAPIMAHMLPPILTRKATTKRERRRTPMAHIPDPKVEKAEALIAQVDALPGPEMVARVGDDDVQAALETVNGSRHEAAPDSTDDGTGEANAA